MPNKKFLQLLIDSLNSVAEPRLFQTERGYQGELISELKRRFSAAEFPGDPIVEQEYQKTLPLHGITIRPDIIVHIPFDRGNMAERKDGNFVAIEIKLRAGKSEAMNAFENLLLMKEKLNYPLTVFINIDSRNLFTELCPKVIAAQTMCLGVTLEDAKPVVVTSPELKNVAAKCRGPFSVLRRQHDR